MNPGLLQLASASLPIGAYSHSLGLEAAAEVGLLADAGAAEAWIEDYLHGVWARGDAPLWTALYGAWEAPAHNSVRALNDRVLASRESQELLLECTQTGHSLREWLLALPETALPPAQAALVAELQPASYAAVHALAARALALDADAGLLALGWSVLENLCSAALKLVPLGQRQSQALLRRVALQLPAAAARAARYDADSACNAAPMLAILSAQHESQYSRLFRS